MSLNGSRFSLFPNPNNGSFTLSGTLAAVTNDDVYIVVTDMLGREVYNGKTTPQNGKVSAEVSLGDLPGGAYLLRINSDRATETLHFVISK